MPHVGIMENYGAGMGLLVYVWVLVSVCACVGTYMPAWVCAIPYMLQSMSSAKCVVCSKGIPPHNIRAVVLVRADTSVTNKRIWWGCRG